MRMANYGLLIYSDNSFETIRTNVDPGVSDKYCRSNGVVLLVVMPYSWVNLFKDSLDHIPMGRAQEEDMVYDAAMSWVAGDTPKPYAHRRSIGRKK